MNLLLGVLQHPARPMRCLDSIMSQSLQLTRMTFKGTDNRGNTPQSAQRGMKEQMKFWWDSLNAVLVTAQKEGFTHAGLWLDDVQIHTPYFLERCVDVCPDVKQAAGLGHYWMYGSSSDYKHYLTRVWVFNVKDLAPVMPEYQGVTVDPDILWQKAQGLNCQAIAADWDHWIPKVCTNQKWAWVKESCNMHGKYGVDLTEELNYEKETYKVHEILKRHAA